MTDIVLPNDAGAFGVNYAMRPHKFVDRRVFVETLNRYSNFWSVEDHVYVGLGSFAMEDHKLINSSFGTKKLISLEIDADVVARQKFNVPLACILPTQYSTDDFVARKTAILKEVGAPHDAASIVWFDMTDHDTVAAHIAIFEQLLEKSQLGDVVRITVDVDDKTLGKRDDGEPVEDFNRRKFSSLRELLGDRLKPGAKVVDVSRKLGIAKLVLYAFKLAAEKAFENDEVCTFEPISLTSYADGHRMLSVTGAVVERKNAAFCRKKMNLSTVPGGVENWDSLVEIQIPQLTVWEKLCLDREVHAKSTTQLSKKFNFRLHQSISTAELLEGYKTFQRFYPTFRHVLL